MFHQQPHWQTSTWPNTLTTASLSTCMATSKSNMVDLTWLSLLILCPCVCLSQSSNSMWQKDCTVGSVHRLVVLLLYAYSYGYVYSMDPYQLDHGICWKMLTWTSMPITCIPIYLNLPSTLNSDSLSIIWFKATISFILGPSGPSLCVHGFQSLSASHSMWLMICTANTDSWCVTAINLEWWRIVLLHKFSGFRGKYWVHQYGPCPSK